jgi:putative oxidoreductase
MSRFRSLLTLSTIPTANDFGLLVLRVWLGGSMAALHGLGKLQRLQSGGAFMDPFGLGSTASLGLSTSAELLAAVLLVFGLASRWTAALTAVNMVVAFALAHGGALTGDQSGELAFVYLAGFVTLLLTGPGRYSVDHAMTR